MENQRCSFKTFANGLRSRQAIVRDVIRQTRLREIRGGVVSLRKETKFAYDLPLFRCFRSKTQEKAETNQLNCVIRTVDNICLFLNTIAARLRGLYLFQWTTKIETCSFRLVKTAIRRRMSSGPATCSGRSSRRVLGEIETALEISPDRSDGIETRRNAQQS